MYFAGKMYIFIRLKARAKLRGVKLTTMDSTCVISSPYPMFEQ